MERPEPNQVEDYPRQGKLSHLFRKRLTQSDLVSNLMLIGGTTEYLRITLPQSIFQNEINEESGLLVMLYAPKYSSYVTIKPGLPEHIPGYFRLCRNRWVLVAAHNEFEPGDAIDCWGVYVPSSFKGRPELARLGLVMQKVVEEPRRQGLDIPSSFKK